ncbi:branched-chain amino acid ABC transporter substrate-binding protein [Terrabacter tumescens]|nr:branched-chain amino acid ABC transporter substrate-binding protein [Terrabacter tumescens]
MRAATKILVGMMASGMALAACAGGETPAATSTAPAMAGGSTSGTPCTGAIGVMAPITGGAAAIGGEQLNFAKLAVSDYNAKNGTNFSIVEGDTQLDAGQASTVAPQLVSNQAVIGVVGPAGSQEVESVGPAFADAKMAFVSPSATRTSLTSGAFPTFARVIPTDDVQGPTDADFMVSKLGAKKVVIVEEKTSYGAGLSSAVEKALKEKGVDVKRIQVSQKQPDYSSVVALVDADTSVVFATFQIAANTKALANTLQQQSKKAVVFGSDGSFSADFDVPGQYVSSFAPDIKGIPSSKAVADAYTAKYGEFGTFGPPTYVATQVIMTAAAKDCTGTADRAKTSSNVLGVSIPDSILGQPITFTDKGDVKDAKFFIFKIGDDRKPALVN